MTTTLQTFRSLPRILTRGVLSAFWEVESNILKPRESAGEFTLACIYTGSVKVGSARMVAKRVALRDSQFDAHFRKSFLSVKFNNSTCPQGL